MTSTFQTPDLYLCAYLRCLRVPLIAAEKEPNGRRVIFTFDVSGVDIDQISKGWRLGTGMVSAQEYAATIKQIKDLIYHQV